MGLPGHQGKSQTGEWGKDQYLQELAQRCSEGCNAWSCFEWLFLGHSCFLRGKEYRSSLWHLLLLQACLQVFQALPKDVAPLVWSTSGKSETLQSLLGLLLEVVWGKVRTALGRDGAACPKEQSSAVLPRCFPHSPPQGKPADKPAQCLACLRDPM